jgi:hypothetical protein
MNIIAYPLKKGGSKWADNELRLSLRSVEKHWTGEFDKVVVLGTDVPAWVNRDTVMVVEAPGYMDAWKKAIEIAGSGGKILWMNDDISFAKDTNWKDLESPQRRICAGQVGRKTAQKWTTSANGWRKKMGLVMLSLMDAGHTTYNFASHTPYVFEADKLRAIFQKHGKLGYKLSVECAYYNTYLPDIGGTVRVQDKFRCAQPKSVMGDMRHIRFFNLCDGGLTPEMKGYMFGRFPFPCKYEVAPPEINPLRQASFRDHNSQDKNREDRRPVPPVVSVNVDAAAPIAVTPAEQPKSKNERRMAKRAAKLKKKQGGHVNGSPPPEMVKAVEFVSTHEIHKGVTVAIPTNKGVVQLARDRTRAWREAQIATHREQVQNVPLPVPPVAVVAKDSDDGESASEDFES